MTAAELRALLAARLSPGPWEWHEEEDSPVLRGPECPVMFACEVGIPPNVGVVLHSYEEDRALIAAAVNELPGLLDRIEAQDAELDAKHATLVRVADEKREQDAELKRLRELEADARRYRRLQVLGCAPGYSAELERGVVLRFSNLDDFVDADIVAHPSRGEACRAAKAAPECPRCSGLGVVRDQQGCATFFEKCACKAAPEGGEA